MRFFLRFVSFTYQIQKGFKIIISHFVLASLIILKFISHLLQIQISNKLKSMENIVEMLDGIIGKNRNMPTDPMQPTPLAGSSNDAMNILQQIGSENNDKHRKNTISPTAYDGSPSPERLKNEVLESMIKNKRLEASKLAAIENNR